MCFAPQRSALFHHVNLSQCSENGVLWTLWLRNELPTTTACTFSTSQLEKALQTWCFLVHFGFQVCFGPQPGALFQHLNFQKCSEHEVICAFRLRNLPQQHATFRVSSLIYPHGSAPAALASLLVNPPEQQNVGKSTAFCDFSTFSCTCIFFLLTLSLLWSSFLFSSLLFSSLLFSDSHLCIFICPYFQKFDF